MHSPAKLLSSCSLSNVCSPHLTDEVINSRDGALTVLGKVLKTQQAVQNYLVNSLNWWQTTGLLSEAKIFRSPLPNEVKISGRLDRQSVRHKLDLVTSLELMVIMVLSHYYFPSRLSSFSIIIQVKYGLRLWYHHNVQQCTWNAPK